MLKSPKILILTRVMVYIIARENSEHLGKVWRAPPPLHFFRLSPLFSLLPLVFVCCWSLLSPLSSSWSGVASGGKSKDFIERRDEKRRKETKRKETTRRDWKRGEEEEEGKERKGEGARKGGRADFKSLLLFFCPSTDVLFRPRAPLETTDWREHQVETNRAMI